MTGARADLCQQCLGRGEYVHAAPRSTGRPYEGGERCYYRCPAGHQWFCDWREDGPGKAVVSWIEAWDEALHTWGDPPPHDCQRIPPLTS